MSIGLRSENSSIASEIYSFCEQFIAENTAHSGRLPNLNDLATNLKIQTHCSSEGTYYDVLLDRHVLGGLVDELEESLSSAGFYAANVREV